MMNIRENDNMITNGVKPISTDEEGDKLTMSDEEDERRSPENNGEISDDEEGWRCVML